MEYKRFIHSTGAATTASADSLHLKVSSFSSQVYGWLSVGLGITAIVAFLSSFLRWFVVLAPLNPLIAIATLGVSIAINWGINRISFSTATVLFGAYAVLQGLLFGTILPLYALHYGGDVVWVAFASAGALFASATIYARYTRNDLTRVANVLNFAVLGLFAISLMALVLSFFMSVSLIELAIAYVGLIIFVGLIITDSQQIKRLSSQLQMDHESSSKLSLMVALRMYSNVIMVFMYLLRILASNRRRS